MLIHPSPCPFESRYLLRVNTDGPIGFENLPENTLLLALERADFLGISRRYFYQLELRNFSTELQRKEDHRRTLLYDTI